MLESRKFCCERLKGLYTVEKEFGPNFRIIKISDNFKTQSLRRGIEINDYLRYLITSGYDSKLSSSLTDVIFIEYCPFCGNELSRVYSENVFINEEAHDW
ncbi:MAG: hypothetical protein AB3N16_06445 [Flavobacteriaceae bacterium]